MCDVATWPTSPMRYSASEKPRWLGAYRRVREDTCGSVVMDSSTGGVAGVSGPQPDDPPGIVADNGRMQRILGVLRVVEIIIGPMLRRIFQDDVGTVDEADSMLKDPERFLADPAAGSLPFLFIRPF